MQLQPPLIYHVFVTRQGTNLTRQLRALVSGQIHRLGKSLHGLLHVPCSDVIPCARHVQIDPFRGHGTK